MGTELQAARSRYRPPPLVGTGAVGSSGNRPADSPGLHRRRGGYSYRQHVPDNAPHIPPCRFFPTVPVSIHAWRLSWHSAPAGMHRADLSWWPDPWLRSRIATGPTSCLPTPSWRKNTVNRRAAWPQQALISCFLKPWAPSGKRASPPQQQRKQEYRMAVSFLCDREGRLYGGEPLHDAVRAVTPLRPVALSLNCLPARCALPAILHA